MSIKKEMTYAISLFNNNKLNLALQTFETLESNNPFNLDVKYNHAIILGLAGKYRDEQKKYKEILKLDPSDYASYLNLAVSFNETKDYRESIKNSNEAIKLNPDLPEAYEARAIAKQHLELIDSANEDFRIWVDFYTKNKDAKIVNVLKDCLELIKIPAVYSNEKQVGEIRIHINNYLEKIKTNLKKIDLEKIQSNKIGAKIAFKLNRFYLAYQQENDKYLNESYNQIISLLLNSNNIKNIQSTKINKTVAVISTFKYHPKLFILEQLKKIEDKIEVLFVIVNNPIFTIDSLPSNWKTEHINLCPNTLDVEIKKIINKNIDIVFMPDIGMSIESQILSAYKLGKISLMSWLHPVTSGSKNIDYFLSGSYMETTESENEYSEMLVKLPDIGLKISPEDFICTNSSKLEKKIKENIQRETLLIGCIQTPFKYHPKYDQVFVDIAKNNNKIKIIFIKYQDELDRKLIKRIRNLFIINGLDPGIIIQQDRLDKDEYREFLSTLDIVLDTVGWSGGNTSFDCFGMGVPVFTTRQNLMRGNHTAGIYKLMGINELTYESVNELIEGITKYAHNKEKIGDLRIRLLSEFKKIKTDYDISNFINKLATTNR